MAQSRDTEREDTGPEVDEPIHEENGFTLFGRYGEKQGLGRMLRDVFIVVGVMAVLLVAYLYSAKKEKAINDIHKDVQRLLKLDTYHGYQQAHARLLDALKMDDSNAYTISSLAEVDTILWGEHGAEKYKAEAEKYMAESQKRQSHLAEYFSAKALTQIFSGKAADADRELRDIMSRVGHSKLYAALGRALFAEGKNEDAMQILKTAHDLEWNSPRNAHAIGLVYLRKGETSAAHMYFQKGITFNSEHTISLVDKCLCNIIGGDLITVNMKVVDDVLMKPEGEVSNFDLARAHYAKAFASYKLKNYEGAMADVDEAIKLRGDQAEFHDLKGLIHAARAEYQPARDSLDRAVKLNPYTASFHFDLARAYVALGNLDEAGRVMDAYTRYLTEDGKYHVNVAKVYIEAKDYDKAISHGDKAFELEGWNPEPKYIVGLAYQAKKDYEKAGEAYTQAVEIQEAYPEVWHQVGLIYLDQKKFQDAKEALQMAMGYYLKAGASREKQSAVYKDMAAVYLKMNNKKDAQKFENLAKEMLQ